MIIYIPILIYILAVIGLIFLLRKVCKNNSKVIWWAYLTFGVLFPILFVLYILFLFGIGVESHYNVKKDTFLWYATIDADKTIVDFPQIQPIQNVVFNNVGGDSPSIAGGSEIQYQSSADYNSLKKEIMDYLTSQEFEIKEVSEADFYWYVTNIRSDKKGFFTASNKKGEQVYLSLQLNKKSVTSVECAIVY